MYADAGNQVMTGKSLGQTPAGNIVKEAYENWLWRYEQKTLADQRPSWDLATVCYAVCETGEFLNDLGPGVLDFDSEKGCKWQGTPGSPLTNFVVHPPGTDAAFADYLNALLAVGPQ